MRQISSILHVGKFYPPHPGGMETHLQNLVSYESQRLQVEVLVSNSAKETVSEYRDGGRITRLATFGSIASMPITPSLLQHMRGRHDNIVHLHMPNPAAAMAYMLSGHPGRLIVTHHGDTTGRALLRRISDPWVRATMRKAETIIISSQRYLDSSEELTEFRHKCQVIPLGIELSSQPQPPPEQITALRTQYGDQLLLAIGRLVPYKGFATLIRALQHVPGATLLLIGTGPLLEDLKTLAHEVGVADRVHFLGFVDNLQPYFHAARLFVLSSITRAESFGLVQLEAMATGLPVINTDLPSAVPEVSLHGVTGITVPPADEMALAHAAQALLGNAALRQQYGNAARLRAGVFNAQVMGEKTEEIYRRVLNSRQESVEATQFQ